MTFCIADWQAAASIINAAIPYTGPCAICGGPDSRHRLFDAIKSRFTAGESVVELADDYGLGVDVVELLVKLKQ